ncbi:MAG TPA: SGNH/GDSL hydrolase family protein [Thermoanaerobaculia bacterium]|nr:SGNH/GDSL hydrolase family protein [Thermoanaerobaculia bacterium]
MRRARLLRGALLAGSAAAALVVAEAGLRLQARAGADLDTQARRSRPSRWPEIVYELKPDLRGVFRGRPLTTNSHGFRGPEVAREKPPGVFRIAGLGDSQMFGWGVSDEETYLRRLERALDARARRAKQGPRGVEVLNFAVPGYNTVMQVATFEHRALAFSPDLVIVHYARNDLAAPHFALEGLGGPRSYLLTALRAAVAGWRDRGDAVPARASRRARREAASRPYAHLGGRAAYARAMARLAELCRRRGIPVLVLTLERGEEPEMRAAVRRHGMRLVPVVPRFYDYLGERGLARSRGAWARTFRLGRDGHPNPLAHRLIAEALLAEIEGMQERVRPPARSPRPGA